MDCCVCCGCGDVTLLLARSPKTGGREARCCGRQACCEHGEAGESGEGYAGIDCTGEEGVWIGLRDVSWEVGSRGWGFGRRYEIEIAGLPGPGIVEGDDGWRDLYDHCQWKRTDEWGRGKDEAWSDLGCGELFALAGEEVGANVLLASCL